MFSLNPLPQWRGCFPKALCSSERHASRPLRGLGQFSHLAGGCANLLATPQKTGSQKQNTEGVSEVEKGGSYPGNLATRSATSQYRLRCLGS